MPPQSSDAHRDSQVVKALFAALCTTIPEDARLDLLRTSSLELKFLTAVQPRVCSFSHRRRHSLRHPAMSMAVQRFYWARRMQRLSEEMELAEQERERGDAARGQPVDAEAERINAMLAEYANRGDKMGSSTTFSDATQVDGAWGGFSASVSGSLWHYHRMSGASAGDGSGPAGLGSGLHRSLSLSSAQGLPFRSTPAVSESLKTVIKNSGQFVHLLDSTSASGESTTPATSLVNGTASAMNASFGGITSSVGSFFFSKHHRQQQLAAVAAAERGKKTRGKNGMIMSALGMAPDANAVMGNEGMEEEEEFIAFQQAEDLRWENIAMCYDQMLRTANTPCKLAALTAAMNGMLNDVIRRFWDRITVAPAAADYHHRVVSGGDEDEDDESENDDGGERRALETFERDATVSGDSSPLGASGDANHSLGEQNPQKADGETAAGSPAKPPALKKTDAPNASKTKGKRGTRNAAVDKGANTAGSLKTKRAKNKAAAAAADVGGDDARPNTAAKKKKKRRVKSASVKRGGTALYMSPLQYVYLHMRIVAVLMPPGNDLEMEMLESVREDLLMDGAYDEDDLRLEHYFGKAPMLVVPAGVVPPPNPNPPESTLMRPSFGLHHALRGPRYGANGGKSDRRPYRWSDAMIEDGGESMAAGARTVAVKKREGFANDPWDTAQMPWLSYAQFWHSMMELADNWTCSAANPFEYTIFLFELYGDVFGHDWGAEDQSYFNMLKRKHTQQEAEGDRMQESTDVLASFQEMLEDLDDMSGSESAIFMERHFGRRESRTALLSPTRRRSTKCLPRGEGDYDDFSDTSDSSGSIDWTGKHKKDGWRYRRFLDEQSGNWKRSRRKTVLQRSSKSKATSANTNPSEEKDADQDSNEAGMDSGSSEYSVYIIEEELNSNNEVTRHRRLHRHRKHGEDGKEADKKRSRRRKLRRQQPRGSSRSSNDEFMYSDADELGDKRRKYHDSPGTRFRRLDDGRRKDDYLDVYDDNLSSNTSWSSFEDHEELLDEEAWRPLGSLQTEAERQRRIRKRVRHTGVRSERRRYGRDPSYFYGYNSEEGYSSSYDESDSSLMDSANFSDYSYSVDEDEDLQPLRASAEELSTEHREHLQEKKAWLQKMLATKGVHISDETFAERDEEVLLYQLLQATEKLAAKAEAAGIRFEDAEDIGIADFDTALLAKLFAKPKLYTLEELQQTALMQMLLEMNDDGEGKVPLTAAQMDGVLAALLAGRHPGGPPETASMRRRREKMIAEARQLQKNLMEAEQRRLAEEHAERMRKRQAEEAERKGTFDLTEVSGTGDGGSQGSRPTTNERRRPPLTGAEQRPGIGDDVDDDQLILRVQPRGVSPTPPPTVMQPLTGSLQQPHTGHLGWDSDDEGAGAAGEAGLSPLTREERREQAALFREFEAYCVAHAERNSKYKIKFTEYTPEQFEAFFLHLNLGPRQRALLRGRAPLAPPTSSVGGNMHQVRVRSERFLLGGGTLTTTVAGAGADAPEAVKLAPAPIKVFTLTTADSLEGAIRESYLNYMDDKNYLASFAPVQYKHNDSKIIRRAPYSTGGSVPAQPRKEEEALKLPPVHGPAKGAGAARTPTPTLLPQRPAEPRSADGPRPSSRQFRPGAAAQDAPERLPSSLPSREGNADAGSFAASPPLPKRASAVAPPNPPPLSTNTPPAGSTADEVATLAVLLQRAATALSLSEEEISERVSPSAGRLESSNASQLTSTVRRGARKAGRLTNNVTSPATSSKRKGTTQQPGTLSPKPSGSRRLPTPTSAPAKTDPTAVTPSANAQGKKRNNNDSASSISSRGFGDVDSDF